jgi:hypothetical protein
MEEAGSDIFWLLSYLLAWVFCRWHFFRALTMCWHFDQSLSCSAKQSYKREEGDGVEVGWVGVVREMVAGWGVSLTSN